MIAVARNTVQRVRRTVPREVRELLAVLLTATLHLSWPMTGLSRGLLVVPLIAWWAGHVWITARNDPSAMAGWGLRREGIREAGLACAALIAVAAPVMVVTGLLRGAHPSPLMLVAVAAYPVWGLVQQLLVQGVVTRGISLLPGRWGHPVVAVLVSSAAFSLAHWPDPTLMVATFGLGLVLAGTGTVLLVTGGQHDEVALGVSPGGVRLLFTR
ncbi:MAG: CPBP family intramembrane metalloprotease [Myxococcales bacterium]|nr:CPBP family intramembrane metalloprotease [Myxococcales bacterium]